MQIEGGTGSGHKARVDADNRLHVFATSESEIHFASNEGLAFAWTAVNADLAALDTALLLCNDDPDRLLHIDRAYIFSDVPTAIKFHFPAYATWAGTAITGKNFNRTSNKIALASCYADETGNAFAAGNSFLTLQTNEVTTDQFGVMVDFQNAVILGYHDSIAIDVVADSGAFEATLWGYFENTDE